MVRITTFTCSLPFFLAGVLCGCGAPEPAQRDRFFSLEPPIQVAPTGSATVKGVLQVNPLAARGFLGGRQIVFRTAAEPLEVQRYPLLLWEDPPGGAIANRLVAALRAARLFEFTVTQAERARPDYLLGGELNRFAHLPTATTPHVEADFTLALMSGNNRRPLLSRRYRGEEPTRGDNPSAMAEAFNRLTGRLLAEAVQDLQSQRPRLRATPGR